MKRGKQEGMKRPGLFLIPTVIVFLIAIFCAVEEGWAVGAFPRQIKAVRTKLPDLSVQLKPLSQKAQAVVGQNIADLVHVQVSNVGGTASAYALVVVLSVNSSITYDPSPHASLTTGRVIGQKEVKMPLQPGASEVVTIKPVQLPGEMSWGDYFLTAIVDPANLVHETSEANNRAQTGLFVQVDLQYIEQVCNGNDYYVSAGGKGFGAWKNNPVIKVGTATLAMQPNYWHDTYVQAHHLQPGLIPVGSQLLAWSVTDGSRAICRTTMKPWLVPMDMNHCLPNEGPPGTSVQVRCCECLSQGSKKLHLFSGGVPGQPVAEVPVTSWSNGLIVGTIPAVQPGLYSLRVTEAGQSVTLGQGTSFKVL
jgi:hypothetical protein